MKKRSILLTCIVAVMALAMFVGCDNAPVLPSFVVGGTINQTGDFLEGQTFDPSKFTVTITYDNGRIVAADETVSVYLGTDKNSDGKVNAGDTVKADLGKNYADSDICATAAVRVYSIKSIAVEGPESYAVAGTSFEVPASDLTVTATYLDSSNAEKTMVLVPGEYTVDPVALPTLSEDNPTAEASAKVTANIGKFLDVAAETQFDFTATWDGESTKLPEDAEIESISAEFVKDFSFNQLNYGDEAPAIDGSRIEVTAKVVGDDKEYKVASSDVEFSLVDKKGLPLINYNFKDVSEVYVKASYEGFEAITQAVNVLEVTVSAELAGFEAPEAIYAGDELPEITGVRYVWETDNGAGIIPADEVELVYAYTATAEPTVEGSTPVVGELVAGNYLMVYPVYKGVPATNGIYLGYVQAKAITYTIESVDLSGITFPAQQFEKAPAIKSSEVSSIVIKPSEGDTLTLPGNNSAISLAYSLTDGSMTELKDGVDLRDVDTIYVQVTFTKDTSKVIDYFPLALVPAYADRLDVEVDYSAKTSEGKPLAGATADLTVYAVNDYGIVAELAADEYNVINTVTNLIDEVTVSETVNTYSLNAIVEGATGPKKISSTENLTIPAWTPYYSIEKLEIKPVESEEPVYYYLGNEIELLTSNYVVTGYTAHGTTDPIAITGFEYVTEYFAVGDNPVYAKVSYADVTGKTVNELVPFTVTGYDFPVSVVATLKESVTEVFPGQEYTADMFDFAVTMKSGAKYDDGTLPEGFQIAMHGTMTAGVAGRPEAVVFDWSCNGVKNEISSETVIPVQDYPVTVEPSQNKTIWYQAAYTADIFDFVITWKSGLEYTEDSGLTAPTVNYTFNPEKAGPNHVAQDVIITWSCGTAEGDVTVNVTPGADV